MLYLAPFHTVNVYFLKQLLDTTKKSIKADKIKVLYVPQYETLSSEEILKWAFTHMPSIADYFPDERDIHMLPRQVSLWLVTWLYQTVALVHHQRRLYAHRCSFRQMGEREVRLAQP